MPIKDILLPEFDMEMDNTRRTLDRVPDDKFGWKPHEKSGTLGWLASHVANLPHWAEITMQQDSLDIAPASGPSFVLPKPASRKELLEAFDKNRAEARAALAAGNDKTYGQPWALLMGGSSCSANRAAPCCAAWCSITSSIIADNSPYISAC